jgi:hypothetical protein
MRIKFIAILILINNVLIAQDRSNFTWIFGGGGLYAHFVNNNSSPIVSQLWPGGVGINAPYFTLFAHSSICDSANGNLLFSCNGFRVFDTLGMLMENGDSLVPKKLFAKSTGKFGIFTQSSLILRKGNGGLYYIFIPAFTDSAITYFDTMSLANNMRYGVPFDLLQYHIIDMNANGGLGKVIAKNIPLLQNRRLNRVGMQACKHANGYDWWLLKQAEYDSTLVYRFLVTADGISGPDSQVFKPGVCSISDERGQASFSKDGTKYCYAAARRHKLFVADFDRCSGLLSNAKVVNIPYDSTKNPGDATLGRLDSMVTGTSFSSNDSFIYVASSMNVYQYELHNNNPSNAWFHVQYGPDTTLFAFGEFGNMLRAVDDKIYIGQGSGTFGGLAVINCPNKKGAACGYCPRCLRDNGGYYSPTSPSNMPDYALGAKPELCWPLKNEELETLNFPLRVCPNPASTLLHVECARFKIGDALEVYNSTGQVLLRQKVFAISNTIYIAPLPTGLYLIKTKYGAVRFLKE